MNETKSNNTADSLLYYQSNEYLCMFVTKNISMHV